MCTAKTTHRSLNCSILRFEPMPRLFLSVIRTLPLHLNCPLLTHFGGLCMSNELAEDKTKNERVNKCFDSCSENDVKIALPESNLARRTWINSARLPKTQSGEARLVSFACYISKYVIKNSSKISLFDFIFCYKKNKNKYIYFLHKIQSSIISPAVPQKPHYRVNFLGSLPLIFLNLRAFCCSSLFMVLKWP